MGNRSFKSIITGAGRCRVDVAAHPTGAIAFVVSAMYTKSWFAGKHYIVDPVTFLLFTEKLAECSDYTQPFRFAIPGPVENHGKHTSKEIVVEPYAIKPMQVECGLAGPVVYELIKKADAMLDQSIQRQLAQGIYTEEAKKKLLEHETMMSVYRREHAKMLGYDAATVMVPDNGTIN
jgi:hypothetical protein